MTRFSGYLDDFGMVTLTLAGPLAAKFKAIREAGFSHVMLDAKDIAADAGGMDSAVQAVKASGLRVSGLQWLLDFEGLTGRQHDYKVEVAKGMLQMAHAPAPVLLAAASANRTSSSDLATIARDLRTLAMMAVPLGLKVAYEGHGGAHRIRDHFAAWDVVWRADMPNLGIAIDTAHAVASPSSLDDLDLLDPYKIFVVRLADFMQPGAACPKGRRQLRSSRARAIKARPWPTWCGAWPLWASAATTASRSSTTTTGNCRRPWWPAAPGRPANGWAKTFCAVPCPCPAGCGCGRPARLERHHVRNTQVAHKGRHAPAHGHPRLCQHRAAVCA
jgi:sugar phosphate isomerase/epimerase